MRNLVAVAGYVLLSDGDPTGGRRALSRAAASIRRDRKASPGDVLTHDEHVLFDGRFGVVTVFEGGAASNNQPIDLAVNSATAAIAIGEVWSTAYNRTSSPRSSTVITDALRDDKTAPGRLNGIYSAVLYDDLTRTVQLVPRPIGASAPLLPSNARPACVQFNYPIPSGRGSDSLSGSRSTSSLNSCPLGFLASDETYIPGVHRLASGSIVTCSADHYSERRYWGFEYQTDDARGDSLAAHTEECYSLLRAAARRMVRAPENTGVLLSGGLDSRATLGTLVHEFGPHFVTRTYGLTETTDVRTGEAGGQRAFVPS